MRLRLFGLMAVLVPVAILFFLRHHIYQLAEVAVTYSTYHNLIRVHPDLLYRYPTDVEPKTEQVPKIMHQVALGAANLAKYESAIQSCRALHPTWDHRLWTDDNSTAFLAEHYPDILPHYTGYHQEIQRANVIRYALLHKYGGVYLDLDVSCHTALDDTPIVNLPFVTPAAYPAGINNAFIATKPQHPFLSLLLAAVPHHNMFWGILVRVPYVENMMSTGCMYFTNRWMTYVRALLAGSADDRVYILATEDGDTEPHMLRGKVTTPLFSHGGASSWHSWDAALIMAVSKHYVLYALLVPVVIVALVLAAIHGCRSVRRRAYLRRRGWAHVPTTDDDWTSQDEPKAPATTSSSTSLWAVLGSLVRGGSSKS